jgi:hypothetical protein
MIPMLFSLFLLGGEVTDEIRLYDTVKLTNGSVLTGLIREGPENGSVRIALVGSDGKVAGSDEVAIERQKIAEIVPRRTPRMIFNDQLKKRNLMNAQEVLELASWSSREEVGLAEEATTLAHRALRLAPDERTVYPLLEKLLAKKDTASLEPAEKDREIELAERAREHDIFLPRAFLRAAQVLAGDAAGGWSVLADEAAALLGLVREKGTDEEKAEATEALAHLYLRGERLDELLKLMEAAPESLQEKLRLELINRLLGRDTADDLAAAGETIAKLPPGPDRKVLEASLAWRSGDAARTEQLLLEAVEETRSPETALALGVVLALEGKRKTAEEVAKLVPLSGPDGIFLSYLLGKTENLQALADSLPAVPGVALLQAEETLMRGDAVEAQAALARFLERKDASPSVRALAWPLQAKISYAERAIDAAVRALLYARAALPREGRLSLALANLAALGGDIPGARSYFADAVKLGAPAAPTALADSYIAFRAGELGRCGTVLRSCAGNPALGERERRYVADLGQAVWEATHLETWEDRFDRADGAEVLNAWNEEEKYGIQITLAGKAVTFAGEQTGSLEASTYLSRYADWERFYRASCRLRPVRGDCAFGLLVIQEKDALMVGRLDGETFEIVTRRASVEKREPLNVPFAPGQTYTITLELAPSGDPVATVDGTTVTSTARLRFGKKTPVKVGCFCRGLARGSGVEMNVEWFRLWRLLDGGAKKSGKKP